MAYLGIHKALTQSIIDLNLGLTIAHENADFDPKGLTSYIKVDTLFNEQDSVTKQGFNEVTGIYQVSCLVKSGGSIAAITNTVDALTAHYKNSTVFTSEEQNVEILTVGRNGGRNDNGWYVVDVSVSFRSDIQR